MRWAVESALRLAIVRGNLVLPRMPRILGQNGSYQRPKMKAIAEARGEPKLPERPILVLPVSKYFASVYKICQAMVDSSSSPEDA